MGFDDAASHLEQRNTKYSNEISATFFPAKPLGCYGDGGVLFTNEVVSIK